MEGIRVVERRLLAILGAIAMAVLGGCAQVVELGVEPARPGFVECGGATDFAFVGESTLAELGLDEFGGGPEATKRGMIWVTRERVGLGGISLPPGAVPPEPSRLVCVEWPDGSGMESTIADDWQPPGGVTGLAGEAPADGPPTALLALVVGAALIVGVSFLAFRRPSAPG